MNNDFKLLNKIKYLINYIDKYVYSSFPKYYLALKINSEKCLYMILEESFRARLNNGNIRIKHIKEILINVSLIDYYLGVMYENKIIISKRYTPCINVLTDIYKMSLGWLNNEESKKCVS